MDNNSSSATKPGAKYEITSSVLKKMIALKTLVIIRNKIKIIEKKIFESFLDWLCWSRYKGIKTLLIAPSANILLNKLGNLKANINASESSEAPKKFANKISLKRPVILDIKILELIFDKLLSFIIKNISIQTRNYLETLLIRFQSI